MCLTLNKGRWARRCFGSMGRGVGGHSPCRELGGLFQERLELDLNGQMGLGFPARGGHKRSVMGRGSCQSVERVGRPTKGFECHSTRCQLHVRQNPW